MRKQFWEMDHLDFMRKVLIQEAKVSLRRCQKVVLFSVIAEGDTVKPIKDMKLEDKIAFISTGGGAMFEFWLKDILLVLTHLSK